LGEKQVGQSERGRSVDGALQPREGLRRVAAGLRQRSEVQVDGIAAMLGQELFVLFDHLGTISLHAADANPLVFLIEENVVRRGVEGLAEELDLARRPFGIGQAHVVRRLEFIETTEDCAGWPAGLRVDRRARGQKDKKRA